MKLSLRTIVILAALMTLLGLAAACGDNDTSSSDDLSGLPTVSHAQLTVEARGFILPAPDPKGVKGEYIPPGEATPIRAPATVAPAVPHGGENGKVARPIPTLAPRIVECNEGLPIVVKTDDGEILGCTEDPTAGSEEANY